MTESLRAVPVFLVCGPSFAWPGEHIYAIFYTEEEANDYIKEEYNPFLYLRTNFIYTNESRDTSTE
jgi:hypothetical protein